MLAYLGNADLLDLIEYVHHGLKSYELTRSIPVRIAMLMMTSQRDKGLLAAMDHSPPDTGLLLPDPVSTFIHH
jgi:hypothetical protein